MKRKLFFKFFVLAVIAAFVTITSCKDYDDDIKDVQKQVDALKKSVDGIQSSIKDGGVSIKNVETTPTGLKITLSDGKSYELKNGTNGTPAAVYTMDEKTGNWFMDGKDTGKPWKGQKGADGVFYVPDADGYWHKFVDGKDTGKTDQKWQTPGGGTPGTTAGLIAKWNKETKTVTLENVEGYDGPVILGASILTSLVFYPELYVDGVETIEFRPMLSETRVEATKPGCEIVGEDAPKRKCFETLGELFVIGGNEYRIIHPGKTFAYYHVSPATLNIGMIDKDKLDVTSHKAKFTFKSGGIEDEMENPFTAQYEGLTNGKIKVNYTVDYNKLSKAYGLDDIYFDEAVLALQAPHSKAAMNVLPAGANPFVTSDFAQVSINPIIVNRIDIAKIVEKNNFVTLSDYLGRVKSTDVTPPSSIVGIPFGKYNAKDLNERYLMVGLPEKGTINLVDYITACTSKASEANKYQYVSVPGRDVFEALDYGFTWIFDKLDGNDKEFEYKLLKSETDQQKFIEVTDASKGTVKAVVYGDDANGAAQGRTPIIRARLMYKDCVVSQAFIKVIIGDDQSAGKHEMTIVADKKAGCSGITATLGTVEVNKDLYNKLGISKAIFDETYVGANGDLSNVDLEGPGTFGWNIDNPEETTTTRPVWTLTACDKYCNIDWTKAKEWKATTIVTVEPKNGKSGKTLIFTFTGVLTKPEINFAGDKLNNVYWNDDKTFIQVNPTVPQAGVTTPDFKIDLNASFSQKLMKDGKPTGLLDLGKELVPYQYIFAKDQPKPAVNGIKFKVSPNGKELIAVNENNNAEEVIVTITDHTALSYKEGADQPAKAKDMLVLHKTEMAQLLLNAGDQSLVANLQIKGDCSDCVGNKLIVTVNGKETFAAKFTRPIRFANYGKDNYLDGVSEGEIGSVLDITSIYDLVDWRKYSLTQPINAHLYTYYGVVAGSYGLADQTDYPVKWDAFGKLQRIPDNVIVKQVDKAQILAWDKAKTGKPNEGTIMKYKLNKEGDSYVDAAGANIAEPTVPVNPEAFKYGAIVYLNGGQIVTKEFNLYIPVTVTYSWGTIVSQEVPVTVKPTVGRN